MGRAEEVGARARRRPRRERVVQETNQIVGDRRWWALGAVLTTTFFSSMYQTILSTALPVIVGDLHGLSLYSWVFTAYMMASAITMPIYGKLSDVYGRKPFYVFGLVLFALGSAASGAVRTMEQLIVARAFQGVGAGAMLSMPRATVGDIFSPRERGRWMGVIGSVFGLASIVGPVVGGWITDQMGWRWVFYLPLPIALAALAAVVYALPTVRTGRRVRIDWRGATLLTAGLIPLVLGFTAAEGGMGRSPQVLGLLGAAFLLLTLFVLAERRAEEPVLEPALFRNRIFTSANLVVFLTSFALFGAIAFVPLYAQGVLGQTAQASGSILTPMLLSFVAGSIVAGQVVTRTGRYKGLAVGGSLLLAVGMYLATTMGPATPAATAVRNVVLIGLGSGAVMPVLNVAVQNAFPYRLMGMVSATQQFVQSLGGILSAPILGTVLVRRFHAELARRIPPELEGILAGLPEAERAALSSPQDLISASTQAALEERFAALGARGAELYPPFIDAVRSSLASGTESLFLVGFVVALLAAVSALFLKELRLQREEYFSSAGGT